MQGDELLTREEMEAIARGEWVSEYVEEPEEEFWEGSEVVSEYDEYEEVMSQLYPDVKRRYFTETGHLNAPWNDLFYTNPDTKQWDVRPDVIDEILRFGHRYVPMSKAQGILWAKIISDRSGIPLEKLVQHV